MFGCRLEGGQWPVEIIQTERAVAPWFSSGEGRGGPIREKHYRNQLLSKKGQEMEVEKGNPWQSLNSGVVARERDARGKGPEKRGSSTGPGITRGGSWKKGKG